MALAEDLGWPLLALDPIKETLADVLGLGAEDWSDRVGDAAAEVVFRLCAQFPTVIARAGGAEAGATGHGASSPRQLRCSATANRSWQRAGCAVGTLPVDIRSTATSSIHR